MGSIKLLWARSVFALDKLAGRIGVSNEQMVHDLRTLDLDLVRKLGPDVFSLAYLTWSYKDKYEKQRQMQMDDALDWAYRTGNLFGRLELPPNQTAFDPVECGRKGRETRHKPMRDLRAWAVEKYLEKKWPSANAAATDLETDVIEHGRKIGAILAKSNARRTIAEWFRKSS